MILLHCVVQVFALPQAATSSDCAVLFEFVNRHRVCPVLVDVDYPRHGVACIRQRPAKEAFRRVRIPLGGQQEIDGLPTGVNRPI